MKKASEIVQKIESPYVGDDCIQVMISYKDKITLFNQEGVIYSHQNGLPIFCNKYVIDERRKQFPYSNIPVHYTKNGLSGKMSCTNQLLDFEKPYIQIRDGVMIESFAVLDKKEAFLIHSILSGERRQVYVTKSELEDLLSSNTSGIEKKFIIYLDNEALNRKPITSLTEEDISLFVKSEITEITAEFRKYVENNRYSLVGSYLLQHPLFLDFVSQSVQNLDLNKMELNIKLKGGQAIIVNMNGNEMALQYIETTFIHSNKYRIDIVDIPVTKYTLEQLKYFAQIIKTKEPKIPLRFNPNVSRQDIQEAKQMVKVLRK